jgi:hypothetical protein
VFVALVRETLIGDAGSGHTTDPKHMVALAEHAE